MNKAILAVALVALVMGVASANKLQHRINRPHSQSLQSQSQSQSQSQQQHQLNLHDQEGFEQESGHLEHPHQSFADETESEQLESPRHTGFAHHGQHRQHQFGGEQREAQLAGEHRELEGLRGDFEGQREQHREPQLHRHREQQAVSDPQRFGGEQRLGEQREGQLEGLRSQQGRKHIHRQQVGQQQQLKQQTKQVSATKRAALRTQQQQQPSHSVGLTGAAAFRDQEAHQARLERNNRFADRKAVSGKKGFVAGDKKAAEADFQNQHDNDNSAIHKHQVLNRNKVIIKDQTTGVNDVDGFRQHRGDSESAHLGASEGKFVAAGAAGKASSDREFDREDSAALSGEESREGAVGHEFGSTF